MRRTLATALLAAAAAIVHGQTSTPADASVSGTVIDATSGAPVEGLSVSAQPVAGRPVSCGNASDAAGRFHCGNLAAGEYYFHANTSSGSGRTPSLYSGGWYGQRGPNATPQTFGVKPGEQVNGLALRVWKNAGIRGRVLDSRGEPMAGVTVEGMRLLKSGSQSVPSGSGTSAVTDASGNYEIDGYAPGDYVVALKTLKPTLNSRRVDLPTTFFPDALSLGAAGTVTLAAGDQRAGLDIRLPAGPRFAVSGIVTGRDVPRGVPTSGARESATTISLVPIDAPQTPDGLEVARTDDWSAFGGGGARDRTGGFTLNGVPPGRYLLRILLFPPSPGMGHTMGPSSYMMPSAGVAPAPAEPTLWAEVPITVVDKDVSDVIVALRSGARISGRVVFDGASTPSVTLPAFGVVASPADGRFGVAVGATETGGQFHTMGLPPGQYVLGVIPTAIAPGPRPEWTVQSVMVGREDATARAFDVAAKDIEDAVITVTDRPATISGRVLDAAGQPRADASVYVFPANRALWTEINFFAAARLREWRSRRDGTYRDAMPPGEYIVAASTDAPADWMRTDVLEQLTRVGTAVTIAPHEQRTLDLRVR